jgi:hypothetical protein
VIVDDEHRAGGVRHRARHQRGGVLLRQRGLRLARRRLPAQLQDPRAATRRIDQRVRELLVGTVEDRVEAGQRRAQVHPGDQSNGGGCSAIPASKDRRGFGRGMPPTS